MTFCLPFRFLPSRPSFLHDHFTTQHSDFSRLFTVSTTDKPVNRSVHAYADTQLNVFFALMGFIFRDIHKKQGRNFSNSGYKIQNYVAGKYTCARAPLARKRKYTNRIFGSKDGTTSMKIVNQSEKQLLFKWLAYQVQSY